VQALPQVSVDLIVSVVYQLVRLVIFQLTTLLVTVAVYLMLQQKYQVVVTNTNVPVLGEQYAWYYAVGNALVFTTIPDQFTGTVGSISNVNTYIGNTANVFTFGITNNSGNTAVVNYGYTKL
jgi:hypothetical protein